MYKSNMETFNRLVTRSPFVEFNPSWLDYMDNPIHAIENELAPVLYPYSIMSSIDDNGYRFAIMGVGNYRNIIFYESPRMGNTGKMEDALFICYHKKDHHFVSKTVFSNYCSHVVKEITDSDLKEMCKDFAVFTQAGSSEVKQIVRDNMRIRAVLLDPTIVFTS